MRAILVLESKANSNQITPQTIFSILKTIKNIDYSQENFVAFFFDTQNHLISSEVLFIGGINFSAVDSRILFKRALIHGATSIVIAHNHPSGDLEPSIVDYTFYSQIRVMGNFLGIPILECIVFSKTEYYAVQEQK